MQQFSTPFPSWTSCFIPCARDWISLKGQLVLQTKQWKRDGELHTSFLRLSVQLGVSLARNDGKNCRRRFSGLLPNAICWKVCTLVYIHHVQSVESHNTVSHIHFSSKPISVSVGHYTSCVILCCIGVLGTEFHTEGGRHHIRKWNKMWTETC